MKFLNWNWKAIGIWSLIITTLISGWLAWHYYNLNQAKDQKPALIAASKNDFQVNPDKKVKDTSGTSHFIVPAHQNVFNQTTIAQNPDINLGGADTVALAMDIQRKQIQQWQQIATLSEARALKAENKLDSAGRLVRYYKSKFIQLAYHPPISSDSTDHGTFDYKKYEDLNVLQYWKRMHLIGPKKSFIDISSLDTNTTITNYRTFEVQSDPFPFSLTVQPRMDYFFTSGRFVPSASLIAGYKNWEVGYKYYYSHLYQALKPALTFSYNIRLW
jgi:hypothetical protein